MKERTIQKAAAAGVVEPDYSRKWLVLAAVAMGIFLATIDGSIVNVALPTLVRAFATTFAVVQWVVLAYLLVLATVILSVGRLGDMIGKKGIYTAGFVVFTLASVAAGLSPSIGWLIAFRAVQALGAAMVLALGIAILTESFPPSERGRALGWSGAMVSIGIVAGPALGGLLIDTLSWRWIFFVNLPVGIVGTLTAIRFVPALKPAGGQRFDFAGSGTLFVSLLSLLLGLTIAQNRGFGALPVLGLLTVWLVTLALFLAIERRSPNPMIALGIFRSSALSLGLVTGLVTFFSVAGVLILMPFYLENVLGFDPRATGLLLAVTPILLGVASPISGGLADRYGTRPVAVVGLLVLLAGYLGLRALSTYTTAPGYIIALLPIGLGMGIFQSPNNSAIMGSVPREHYGIASGLVSITRILGQITGIAVLGAAWTARVAHHAPQFQGQATTAPTGAQVAALHDTFSGVALLLGLAFLLALWNWSRQRRSMGLALAEEG